MKLTLSLFTTALAVSTSSAVLANVIPPGRESTMPSSERLIRRVHDLSIPALNSRSLDTSQISGLLSATSPSPSKSTHLLARGDALSDSTAPGEVNANEKALSNATKQLNININNANTNANTNSQPSNSNPPSESGSNTNADNDISDIQYLNYHLFVEQFLVSFFEHGLQKYNASDFVGGGFPGWVRGRYSQILEHEKAHKEFLESAIAGAGAHPVLPCRYEFNDANVHDYVAISAALTTIVSGSYVGSLQCFNNRAYITTGASILSVEARQAAWINGAVRKINPWNTAFETPLTPNEVVTLLLSFMDFDTCPQENRNLLPPNFRPYPVLTLAPRLVPGEEAEISFPYPGNLEQGERLYVAFLVGIETIFAPVEERRHSKRGNENMANTNNFGVSSGDNTGRFFVQLPRDLASTGTVYFTLVRGTDNIREIRLDDHSIVAGPAIAEFPFDSEYKPITW